MSDRRREVDEIKVMLKVQVEALARHLAPEGRRAGKYWIAKNPTRDDRHAGSFWVMLSGAPGAWKDEATGDKGDVLALVQYVTGLDFKASVAWCRDWLGVQKIDDAALRDARRRVAISREDDLKRQAKLLERNRRRAFAIWLDADPNIEATPVATYLAHRGIDLERLQRPPGGIRYAMRRHIETGMMLPCMLSLMIGPDPSGLKEGIPYAIHCTFLDLDGTRKAPVAPARKIWPSYSGGAIRLARGEHGMTPSEAAEHGLIDTLCICEGVEDGLSIALACPGLRVWAAASVGNIKQIVLPKCCGEVIVAADNDWGKPQAKAQLDAGVRALEAQGRPVRVARSLFGKDANDALLSAPSGADQHPARAFSEAAS